MADELFARISRLEKMLETYHVALEGLVAQLQTVLWRGITGTPIGIQPLLIPLMADDEIAGLAARPHGKCSAVASLEIAEPMQGKFVYKQLGNQNEDCPDYTPEDIGKAIEDAEEQARRTWKAHCNAVTCPVSLNPLGFRTCGPVITAVKLVSTNKSSETGEWNGIKKKCYVTADIQATVSCRCSAPVPFINILP
jgi:hypothetical protein